MAGKTQPPEAFVDSEPQTRMYAFVDLQIDEVLNENINTLKGNVNIDNQCDTDDT
jgi:hypothetical protein